MSDVLPLPEPREKACHGFLSTDLQSLFGTFVQALTSAMYSNLEMEAERPSSGQMSER